MTAQEIEQEIRNIEQINELKDISKDSLQELDIVSKEEYLLDITRPYYNLLQRNEKFKNIEHSQRFVWDYNTAFMEDKDKTYIYLQDELGSLIRLLELGEGKDAKQMVYGYDKFGVDTYKTQGKIQLFGYTGYRHDKVANTYFAQAREYMQGVGRFGGEDWIKGSIEKPFSLNQYGYCWGNPINWLDRDGKYPEMPLISPNPNLFSPDFDSFRAIFGYIKTKTETEIQKFVKNNTGVDITTVEADLIMSFPANALKVKNAAKKADEWTDKIFGGYYKELEGVGRHWQDGDAANAYRHAMWNAFMTKEFGTGDMGATHAALWATAHELWPKEVLDAMHAGGFTRREHSIMDLHNNAQGREVVKALEFFISDEEISNRVLEKLRNCKLKVLIKDGWYNEIYQCETSK